RRNDFHISDRADLNVQPDQVHGRTFVRTKCRLGRAGARRLSRAVEGCGPGVMASDSVWSCSSCVSGIHSAWVNSLVSAISSGPRTFDSRRRHYVIAGSGRGRGAVAPLCNPGGIRNAGGNIYTSLSSHVWHLVFEDKEKCSPRLAASCVRSTSTTAIASGAMRWTLFTGASSVLETLPTTSALMSATELHRFGA